MYKKLAVGLAGIATIAAGAAVLVPQAQASDGQLPTATVAVGEGYHLNVRTEPQSEASIRSAFLDGSVVELFCQTEGSSVDAGSGEDPTWYGVKGGGYVAGAWLDQSADVQACGDEAAPGYGVTANGFGGSVNVRAGAHGEAPIVGSMPDGSAGTADCWVQGTEHTNDAGETSDWWFRVTGGFVTAAYVQADASASTLPVCSDAGATEPPADEPAPDEPAPEEPAPEAPGQADQNYYLPFANGTSVPVTQSPYGSFSHNNANNYHAIDIGMPEGTPLLAPGAGTVVVAADRSDGYGQAVYIDHGDNRCTQLAHMSRIDVAVGQQVSPGDGVGAVGSTGQSTGAHLHWNIVACDGYTSLEIPNTIESGTEYAQGAQIVSQNPGF